jgi:hypothetical protein
LREKAKGKGQKRISLFPFAFSLSIKALSTGFHESFYVFPGYFRFDDVAGSTDKTAALTRGIRWI